MNSDFSKPKIKIFTYTNFRNFLADYYEEKKTLSTTFSYRQFSKKCGFKSPNFLKLVIDGQRNLTQDSMERFINALELPAKEGEFFRQMVQFNQSKTDSERTKFYKAMQNLIPYNLKRDLEVDSVEYLSHWLNPVIREMALSEDFRDDPYWITRRITGRANQKDIVKSLNFLKKSGFIVKDDDGKFSCPDKIVLSSDEILNLAVQKYHREVLLQGIESLEDLPVDQREYGAVIFSIPISKLTELKQKIKNFRDELSEWAVENESKSEAQVIQMNLQMFPQTKVK